MTESLLTADNDLLGDDLFIKPQRKNKILFLSDHPLAPSGVGVQARFLIEGLVKTGRYSFRCLGGAIKHQDYRTIKVNDDFVVKPVDGFGTHEMIRQLLITERPDALIIFTDPRQFIWLWEIEDEIHQLCPIAYWHVWDNDPYPAFNKPFYDSTDLINCLSYKTYELVKPNFPEKTEYVPHAFPKYVFFEMPEVERQHLMVQNFGPRAGWFKALWVNRNATRKLPADVLDSWRMFLDNLEAKYGHRNALLVMHTDPKDPEGPDLLQVAEQFGLQNNVWFSTDKLQFDKMNILHNLMDVTVNTAKNEGFGLSTLISMQVGKPIIALKTGGETSKVVDYRDGSTHGVALEPIKRTLVGSQLVPYIYEDYAGTQELADAFMTVHDYSPEERAAMSKKCKDYVDFQFNHEDIVKKWDTTLTKCIDDFKANSKGKRWELLQLKTVVAGESSVVERNPDRLVEANEEHANLEALRVQEILNEQNGLAESATAPGKKRIAAKKRKTTAAATKKPKQSRSKGGK